MKKLISILAVASVLTACSSTDLSQYTTASKDDPIKVRLRACMLNEANAKFQAGTLMAAGISDTADEITNTCIKKLALQSAGLDTEANQSMASSILNGLLKTGSNK
ncbi:MAG: hypothetical protein IJ752_00075 [Alphaproteobacteria bacterium]|nr:hypothetical protein [Alphaproteobacteria bacterium]